VNVANYIITGLGIVACLAFISGYWWVTRGAWIHEEPGRFMMAYTGTVLFLLLIVIGMPLPLRRYLATVLYAMFVATLWWPLRMLWIAQRDKR